MTDDSAFHSTGKYDARCTWFSTTGMYGHRGTSITTECCVQFHLNRLPGLSLHCTYLSLPYFSINIIYKCISIYLSLYNSILCSSISHVGQWAVASSYSSFSATCMMSNRPWTPKHCTAGCSHCTTQASRSPHFYPFMSTSSKILKVDSWFSCVTNSTEHFFPLDEDIGHLAPHKLYRTNIRGSFRQWTWTAAVHG